MARLASVTCGAMWRRDGDSNPGEALTSTRFPGVRLKPLGHPSGEKLPIKLAVGLAAIYQVLAGFSTLSGGAYLLREKIVWLAIPGG